MSPIRRSWYSSWRQPGKAQASLGIHTVSPEPLLFALKVWKYMKGPTKHQTSSPTRWRHMRVGRISLQRRKSTIISWHGSNTVTWNWRTSWVLVKIFICFIQGIQSNHSDSKYSDRSGPTMQTQIRLLLHSSGSKPFYLCTQQRLGSALASTQFDQSSLCAQWIAKDPRFLHGDSKDSDRLTRVFNGRTGHFVGFVMCRLISYSVGIFQTHNCMIKPHCSTFRKITAIFLDVQILWNLQLKVVIRWWALVMIKAEWMPWQFFNRSLSNFNHIAVISDDGQKKCSQRISPENQFMQYANKRGTDQTVICCIDTIIHIDTLP